MDRLRLMQLPPDIVVLIQNAIYQHWPLDIQAVRDYSNSYEFKLKGRPWVGYGEDVVHARRLMRALLATLYNTGWVLALSTDVSKKTSDKDTLMFRYQSAALRYVSGQPLRSAGRTDSGLSKHRPSSFQQLAVCWEIWCKSRRNIW
jgi:hypothetical protein